MTRLGKRVIDLDSVIYFPRGLIGLEDKREYVLLRIEDDSPFILLQNLEDTSLGLLVVDPYSFLTDYNVKLETAEKKILQIENARQVAVMVTVTIPHDRPEETTLNLSGPIIINSEAKRGMQVPQLEAGYPTQYRLNG
jgi:flagellar assembly factor FliW